MIRIGAGIAPSQAQAPFVEVHHQRTNGGFTVHRVDFVDGVIADRIRVVGVIPQNGLQGLDRVTPGLPQQPIRPEVTDAGADHLFGLVLDGLHFGIQKMVGVGDRPILRI